MLYSSFVRVKTVKFSAMFNCRDVLTELQLQGNEGEISSALHVHDLLVTLSKFLVIFYVYD
jgi:hypothetical protein